MTRGVLGVFTLYGSLHSYLSLCPAEFSMVFKLAGADLGHEENLLITTTFWVGLSELEGPIVSGGLL